MATASPAAGQNVPSSPSNPYDTLSLDEIRLIVLHPGGGDTDVYCSLETVKLDKCSKFIALSYHWGEKDVEWSSIRLRGMQHPVTIHLASALRHIRRPEEAQLMWIDQLCINQADLEEKSKQVRLMQTIFSRAAGVFVWLGDADSESDTAIDAMEIISSELESRNPSGTIEQDIEAFAGMKDILTAPDNRRSIGKLTRRKWWFRLWVVQEIYLASGPITVFCGDKSIDWRQLSRAHVAMLRIGTISVSNREQLVTRALNPSTNPMLEAPVQQLSNYLPVHATRPFWKENYSRLKLLDLVAEFQNRHVTDERDRIFALLGLCPPENIAGFRIDYSTTLAEVYKSFACFHLEQHNDIRILSMRRWQSVTERRPHLPTWAPDWSSKRPFTSPLVRWSLSMDHPQYYSAVNVIKSNVIVKSELSLTEESSVLIVKGFRFAPYITATRPQLWDDGIASILTTDLPRLLQASKLAKTESATERPSSVRQNPLMLKYQNFTRHLCQCLLLAHAISAISKKLGSTNTSPTAPSNSGRADELNVNEGQSIQEPESLSPRYNYVTGETVPAALFRTINCNYARNGTRLTGEEKDIDMLTPANLMAMAGHRRSREFASASFRSKMQGLHKSLHGAQMERRFLIVDNKWFGMGPEATRSGDVVAFLLGSIVPIVLRPLGRPSHKWMGNDFYSDKDKRGENKDAKSTHVATNSNNNDRNADNDRNENDDATSNCDELRDNVNDKNDDNVDEGGDYSTDQRYEVIGECYIHGFMDGEIFDYLGVRDQADLDSHCQTFALV